MNNIFSVEHYSNPSPGTKQASHAKRECQAIMDRIYNEDPSYWPYGLSTDYHDDLYIVRDNLTKAAAGFVGWQESEENNRVIGSYTIGILPEYRGNGFAKEAVAKILRKRASGVDEVRAYVMPHNKGSQALARSLHVPVHTEF